MIHIIDDFYPNPDEVREQALEMFYYPGVRGDRVFFPGDRTLSTYSHDNRIIIKNRFESTIGKRIIYFPTKNSNTAFTIGLYKGVKEFLNWCKNENISMAVCTNKTEHLAVDLLKKNRNL